MVIVERVFAEIDKYVTMMTLVEGRPFTSGDPCVSIVHGLLRYRKVYGTAFLLLSFQFWGHITFTQCTDVAGPFLHILHLV